MSEDLVTLVFRIANDSRDIKVQVAPSATVAQVKELIQSQWPDADPPSLAAVRLFYNGCVLADSNTVASSAVGRSAASSTPPIVLLNVLPEPQAAPLPEKPAAGAEEDTCCAVM
eukprot:TRINITY_DN474_c0_g1_i1.p2 TRINITY_DN474_c0_g1~~TRINITY_DN474_c0_g1_i1.p2  ORF type:complete len:114 (-),score=4.89 TRINITY_DN474_c0_g1_i1:355-696(-)